MGRPRCGRGCGSQIRGPVDRGKPGSICGDDLIFDHGCLCGSIAVYHRIFLNSAALEKYFIFVIFIIQFP